MLLSFEKEKKMSAERKSTIVLAGDAGATKTNLALFKWDPGRLMVIHEGRYNSSDYKNILVLIDEFQEGYPSPGVICLGVAGPVLDGHAKLSNIKWEIDCNEISAHFGIEKAHVINDLEATAYGLAVLADSDIKTIHTGSKPAPGNAAIIAPGTGLGEAGLYWDGKNYHPFATEGGHSDFAPRNNFDFELYNFLQKEFGHVSWERLISGPGILNIYRFLRDVKKRDEPGWLKELFTNADAAMVISRNAEKAKICRETMELFIRYLAFECANVALKFKATGGLFIGGGIVPQIVHLLKYDLFSSSYYQSGRLNYLLKKVPVKIILDPKAALVGAAYYAYNHTQ